MQSSSSMLTKNSSSEAQRRHPWTRVSWISGSDADSLDEEEVQEVESITLLGPSPAETAAATAAAAAASSSVVIAPTETEDTTTANMQQHQSSVTLKPFRFGSTTNNSNNNSGGSLLSPFILNDGNTNESVTNPGVSATTSSIINKQDNKDNSEILVSQTGHLITPAVTDVVSEDDEAATPPPPTQSKRSWKSFWTTQGSNDDDNEEEEDNTKVNDIAQTVPAEDDPAAGEQTCQDLVTEPELLKDDDIVEDDDEGTTMLSSRRLEAMKAMTNFQDLAKDCYFWVVDGLLMNLWTKVVSFGILLDTWFRNGINSFKSSYDVTSNKIKTAWEEKASSSPNLSGIMIPGFLLLFLLAVGFRVGSIPSAKRRSPPSPTNDLRDFVRYEKAHNVVDLKQIDDLNTEAFRTYARSTCVEAATFERARAALDMGLYGVPDSIRSTIVPMAIMEGVTQKNSIQDSNNDFVQNGKADAFMAFWSTVYDPRGARTSSSDDGGSAGEVMAYKTCVMVTGVALTVAETVAEWTTKTEQYQIGTEPCHCGYVYCEECPVFDVREVKWPVFERRSLSLRKQEELRRWMVDQAVKSAEHLVLDGSETLSLESSGSSSSSSLAKRPASFSWTGPTSSAYFGEDSHNDRSSPSYTSSFGEEEL